MFSSPSLTERIDGIDIQANNYINDPLNWQLNAVTPQAITTQPIQRAPSSIWQYPDVGLDDRMYNVGYHQLPVDNQVSFIPRYESPEIPVTHLPFKDALFNSTQRTQQAGQKLAFTGLRAPGVNEGFGPD